MTYCEDLGNIVQIRSHLSQYQGVLLSAVYDYYSGLKV